MEQGKEPGLEISIQILGNCAVDRALGRVLASGCLVRRWALTYLFGATHTGQDAFKRNPSRHLQRLSKLSKVMKTRRAFTQITILFGEYRLC